MAYTIRYGHKKTPKKSRLLLLSALFFLLFVLAASLVFPAELAALRGLVISASVRDAVTAFCQDLLDGAFTYGH